MALVLGTLAVGGLIPLGLALWANRRTSLAHALVWATIAWSSWIIAIVLGHAESIELHASRYIALCLTGCAGVAVFGARRPHVAAWDFVVGGQLVVMLLPLAESLLIGASATEGLRMFFLVGTIAICTGNYIPTRLGLAAMLALVACLAELAGPRSWQPLPMIAADGLLIGVPWLGWVCMRHWNTPPSKFDQSWLAFRDRWGMVWSLRAREQFNLAAHNAGWRVHLGWTGLKTRDGAIDHEMMEKCLSTLHAILQRFLPPD
jgi:hypothetical protein